MAWHFNQTGGGVRQKKLEEFWAQATKDLERAIELIRGGMSRGDASEAVGRRRSFVSGYVSSSKGARAPTWIWQQVEQAEAERDAAHKGTQEQAG